MQRIVLNRCYGGFGLSKKAKLLHKEGKSVADLVELLGDEVNDEFSQLEIVLVPDELVPMIEKSDYDGIESIQFNIKPWLVDQISKLTPENAIEWRANVEHILKLIDETNARTH